MCRVSDLQFSTRSRRAAGRARRTRGTRRFDIARAKRSGWAATHLKDEAAERPEVGREVVAARRDDLGRNVPVRQWWWSPRDAARSRRQRPHAARDHHSVVDRERAACHAVVDRKRDIPRARRETIETCRAPPPSRYVTTPRPCVARRTHSGVPTIECVTRFRHMHHTSASRALGRADYRVRHTSTPHSSHERVTRTEGVPTIECVTRVRHTYHTSASHALGRADHRVRLEARLGRQPRKRRRLLVRQRLGEPKVDELHRRGVECVRFASERESEPARGGRRREEGASARRDAAARRRAGVGRAVVSRWGGARAAAALLRPERMEGGV